MKRINFDDASYEQPMEGLGGMHIKVISVRFIQCRKKKPWGLQRVLESQWSQQLLRDATRNPLKQSYSCTKWTELQLHELWMQYIFWIHENLVRLVATLSWDFNLFVQIGTTYLSSIPHHYFTLYLLSFNIRIILATYDTSQLILHEKTCPKCYCYFWCPCWRAIHAQASQQLTLFLESSNQPVKTHKT